MPFEVFNVRLDLRVDVFDHFQLQGVKKRNSNHPLPLLVLEPKRLIRLFTYKFSTLTLTFLKQLCLFTGQYVQVYGDFSLWNDFMFLVGSHGSVPPYCHDASLRKFGNIWYRPVHPEFLFCQLLVLALHDPLLGLEFLIRVDNIIQ